MPFPFPRTRALLWRWLALFRRLLSGKPTDNFDALDFSQAVDVVLTTFGVLVAVSITDFFDEAKNKLAADVRSPWAVLILLALLLRYIIGSAIHLNRTYKGPAQSHSILRFLKDIAFLIAFGVLAIQITHSEKLFHFIQQSAVFVTVSLLWSVIDAFIHRRGRAQNEKPFYAIWIPIDFAQLLLTLVLYQLCGASHLAVELLAFIYILFFGVDLVLMIRVNALKATHF